MNENIITGNNVLKPGILNARGTENGCSIEPSPLSGFLWSYYEPGNVTGGESGPLDGPERLISKHVWWFYLLLEETYCRYGNGQTGHERRRYNETDTYYVTYAYLAYALVGIAGNVRHVFRGTIFRKKVEKVPLSLLSLGFVRKIRLNF